MLVDAIGALLLAIATAAVEAAECELVINDGPDARFVALDPSGPIHGMFIPRGGSVRVPRGFRLIVEPVESLTLRPLCRVRKDWVTQ